jgi:hypothetical protein
MDNYIVEFFVFFCLPLILGIKNLVQWLEWKDKSWSNLAQMSVFLCAITFYSFFNGLPMSMIDKNVVLWTFTAFFFMFLILEAISLGEKRNKYAGKDSESEGKTRQPMPKELKLGWSTFICNLLLFVLAALQVTGVLYSVLVSIS